MNNLYIKRELLFLQYRKSKNIKYLSLKDLNFSISIKNFILNYFSCIEIYVDVIKNQNSIWNKNLPRRYLIEALSVLWQNILRLTQQIGSFFLFEMHCALSSCDFFSTASSCSLLLYSCGIACFQFISRYLQYTISFTFRIFVYSALVR